MSKNRLPGDYTETSSLLTEEDGKQKSTKSEQIYSDVSTYVTKVNKKTIYTVNKLGGADRKYLNIWEKQHFPKIKSVLAACHQAFLMFYQFWGSTPSDDNRCFKTLN